MKETPQLLIRSSKILRMFGCWPDLGNFSSWSEVWYHVYAVVCFGFVLTDVLIKLYGLYVMWFEEWATAELESFIEGVAIFFTGVVMCSKIVIVVTSQKKLRYIMGQLNGDMYNRFVCTNSDRQVMEKCVSHERRLVFLLTSYTYMLGTTFALSPAIYLLKQSRKHHADPGMNSTLSLAHLPMKYPFKLQWSDPVYISLLMFQLVVVVLTSNLSIVPDALYTSIFHYLSGHFEILCNRIKREAYNAEKSARNELNECIKQHHEIIRLTENVKFMSQSIIVVQLFFSSLLICIGIFELSLVKDTELYVKFILYFLIKFSLLLLYCWHGEELMKQSGDVANVCYSSDWTTADIRKQLDTRLVMVRSQKPMVLAAGSFFSLSLETFMNVLRASYSYFTLLQTMNE